MEYYLISRKKRDLKDKFITFWRENNAGYTYFKGSAGIYTDIEEGYHNSEDTSPVQCSIAEPLFIPSPDNYDGGMVIKNSKKNRRILGI